MQPFRDGATFAVLAFLFSANATDAWNSAEAASPGGSNAQSVEVVMTDYKFTPNLLQFRANMPYRLRLVNNTGRDHSFDAPELFAAARIADDDQAKVNKGEIEVDGGQTVDVKFVPQTPGIYKFQCSHFLHATFGMTGEAAVQ
ncbi:MAG TPA: cupredoxin domain-containing protein [Rhizomicrobium sp.]